MSDFRRGAQDLIRFVPDSSDDDGSFGSPRTGTFGAAVREACRQTFPEDCESRYVTTAFYGLGCPPKPFEANERVLVAAGARYSLGDLAGVGFEKTVILVPDPDCKCPYIEFSPALTRCAMDGSGKQAGGIDVTPPLEVAVQALRELCRTLESTDPLESYLTMLCLHAVEAVADADMAGVSLINGETNPRTVACTAQKVREIDDLQYRSWQGPCLDAAERDEVVLADQDLACRCWPGFAAEARRYGVASFLSVPLPYLDVGSRLGVQRGAVTVYSSWPDGFGNTQTALMDLVALAAGHAIMIDECSRGVRTVAVELEQVPGSGAVVDQITAH